MKDVSKYSEMTNFNFSIKLCYSKLIDSEHRLKIKGKSLSGFCQKRLGRVLVIVKLIFFFFWGGPGGGRGGEGEENTLFCFLFIEILKIFKKDAFYTLAFLANSTSYVFNKKMSALQLSFSVWFIQSINTSRNSYYLSCKR